MLLIRCELRHQPIWDPLAPPVHTTDAMGEARCRWIVRFGLVHPGCGRPRTFATAARCAIDPFFYFRGLRTKPARQLNRRQEAREYRDGSRSLVESRLG